MPTVEDYQHQLKQLHPRGKLWTSLLRDDSVYSKFLKGIATEFARIDGRVSDLLDEADPRSTVELLPGWEQGFDIPGVCGYMGASVEERQQILTSKVIEEAKDSNQELIDVAERIDFAPASITEYESHSVDSNVDMPLYDENQRFVITLLATEKPVNAFNVDDDVDNSLGEFLPREKLICAIRERAPAHIFVLFEFQK